jgi:hypothetical protein
MDEDRAVKALPYFWSTEADLEPISRRVFYNAKVNQVLFTSSFTFDDIFNPKGDQPIEDVMYSGQHRDYIRGIWTMIVGVKYANED